MKKFLSILTGIFLTANVFAQSASVSPARFTAEDQITITFDLSTTTWGTGDVYIWAFVPGCCGAPANDVAPYGWTNANPATKCTPIGGGKYTFTLTPTTWMTKTPAQIGSTFGCLAKTANGSSQTADFTFPVDPLTYTPSVFRVFPSKFTQDDVVTFFLDKNLLPAQYINLKDSPVFVYTDIDYTKPDGTSGYFQTAKFCANGIPAYAGQPFVGDSPDLAATDNGGGIWSWTIIPSQFYKIGDASNPGYPVAGSKITRLKVHFRTRVSSYCFGAVFDSGSLGDNFAFPVTQ